MINRKQIRSSQSSMTIASKSKQSGQLTENSCIFDLKNNQGQDTGISVSLALIFDKQVNPNFDVVSWYNNKSEIMKGRISDLMNEIAFNKEFCNQWLKKEAGTQMIRVITADPVKNDDKNILSYLFEITYTRF